MGGVEAGKNGAPANACHSRKPDRAGGVGIRSKTKVVIRV
jgi:hypothetical protein